MRVDIIHAYKPSFISLNRNEYNQPVSRPDCFEKSEFNFDNECKILYSKLEKSMEIVTPQDIVLKAKSISKKTGVNIDNVYETMGLLSQYSSYKSLEVIEKELRKHNITCINNLGRYYNSDNVRTPVSLSTVLNYISIKNFNFKKDYEYEPDNEKALFIDGNVIDIAKKHPDLIKNTQLFYIENFENGYNFLNEKEDFEDFTVKIIEKAKILQENNGKDFGQNIKYILNGQFYKNIADVTDIKRINVIRRENISTPEQIADNLNPIMPDYETFKKVLDNISRSHRISKIDGEKYVINALNSMFEVITPAQLSKYLQNLHSKITADLENNNRDFNNVFYAVPGNAKSFSLINYCYQKANNINNIQNIYINKKSLDYNEFDIKSLPDNSTLIVLDDWMLTGQSMRHEQFPYEITVLRHSDMLDKKNIEIIFAPLFVTKNGLQEFDKFINNMGRNGKDRIITSKILPESHESADNMRVLRSNKYLTSGVMPYMGPDSNAEELVPLYEKFLYSPNAQKQPLSEFGIFGYI